MTESVATQPSELSSTALTRRDYTRLTLRENQVALLVVRGLSNKEVARALGLSHGTVKVHVHNIFQKIGARSRYGLIMQMSSVENAA